MDGSPTNGTGTHDGRGPGEPNGTISPSEAQTAIPSKPLTCGFVERTTGFEPATPTLARWSEHAADQAVCRESRTGKDGRKLQGAGWSDVPAFL
jgi:hypothetical protein